SGWADIYSAGLPCQYIDITGVPPGNYVLQMIVNPDGLLPESNMANNETRVAVTIPPAGCVSAPPNDNFANAQVVNQTPFSFSEFNLCATKQTGEPSHGGNAGGHSVWFNWTPTNSGPVDFNTMGSDFSTDLAVYTGNNITNVIVIASNIDDPEGAGQASRVDFYASSGTTYRIVVDGFGGAVG